MTIHCAPGMKRCCRCRIEKPLDDFWRYKDGKFGRDKKCIECSRKFRNKTNRPYAKIASSRRNYRRELRQQTLNAYGNMCVCCGETTPEFLALDHIHNNGNEHRRLLGRKGSSFHLWLRKQGFPKDEIQILCHNCNMAKGAYGQCLHQRISSDGLLFEVKNRKEIKYDYA